MKHPVMIAAAAAFAAYAIFKPRAATAQVPATVAQVPGAGSQVIDYGPIETVSSPVTSMPPQYYQPQPYYPPQPYPTQTGPNTYTLPPLPQIPSTVLAPTAAPMPLPFTPVVPVMTAAGKYNIAKVSQYYAALIKNQRVEVARCRANKSKATMLPGTVSAAQYGKQNTPLHYWTCSDPNFTSDPTLGWVPLNAPVTAQMVKSNYVPRNLSIEVPGG